MAAAPAAGPVFVAGVGNIFLGDDGFGVEVARRLGSRALPPGVRVADFGVRSLHLAFEILGRDDGTTILVDAMQRGGAPGTVYLVEPDAGDPAPASVGDAHSVTPDAIVGMLRALGGSPRRLLVVGCEPATLDEGIGLSAQVDAAVDEAVALILSIVGDPASARETA